MSGNPLILLGSTLTTNVRLNIKYWVNVIPFHINLIDSVLMLGGFPGRREVSVFSGSINLKNVRMFANFGLFGDCH